MPSFSKTEGPKGGGIILGLLQDSYKGITNFLLKDQAQDLLDAMKNEELLAREKINVIAGND